MHLIEFEILVEEVAVPKKSINKKEIIEMKKTHIIIPLILATQIVFSGCAEINNLAKKLDTKASQSQSATSAATQSAATPDTTSANNSASSTNDTNGTNSADGIKGTSSTDNGINSSSKPAETDTTKSTITPTNNNKTLNETSKTNSSLYNINKKDMESYATMTKANLIKTLGSNYKTEGAALTFSNGLSFFGLNDSKSKPTIIKCTNAVEIIGIKNGMTFSQVQSILGKTNVIDTYIGTKSNKVYKIQYTYGKEVLKVISVNKDGKDSFLEICPL